jgi:predicted PurR-regulated permease PerM
MALVVAFGTEDLMSWVETKFSVQRIWAVLGTLTAAFFLVIAPFLLAVYRVLVFFDQAKESGIEGLSYELLQLKLLLLEKLETLGTSLNLDLAKPIQDLLQKAGAQIGGAAITTSSHFLSSLPSLALHFLVFFFMLLTFLLNASLLKGKFISSKVLSQKQSEGLVDLLRLTCSTTLISTVGIGIIQALVVAIGGLVFDQGDFWIILVVTFFASFVPMVGAAPVGAVLALLSFMESNVSFGIGLVVVAVIAGTIDNVLKPLFVGSRIEAHPLIAFTCVIGAVTVIGLPGLLLGPVIMNLFLSGVPLMMQQES